MIYGIIYSYLEGRKVTDILVMGLNLTMIVSSGLIKTIGKSILQSGVSENLVCLLLQRFYLFHF